MHRPVLHHFLRRLNMLKQGTITIPASGVLMPVVLCRRHHRTPLCLLPQITMPCHLRGQQIRRCFLSFPVLQLLPHILLVITL